MSLLFLTVMPDRVTVRWFCIFCSNFAAGKISIKYNVKN